MFYIFFDPDYKEIDYNKPIPTDKCFFDENSYYYEHFYVATENKEKVCWQCIKNKDPQIANILEFINKGKDLQSKIDKLNIGMEQLRKQIATSDPAARRCPICGIKKAYNDRVQGCSGFSCLNCKVGYKGAGQFVFNDKVYNIEQAKKIFRMKAFT
jgi:hypothetical protein